MKMAGKKHRKRSFSFYSLECLSAVQKEANTFGIFLKDCSDVIQFQLCLQNSLFVQLCVFRCRFPLLTDRLAAYSYILAI